MIEILKEIQRLTQLVGMIPLESVYQYVCSKHCFGGCHLLVFNKNIGIVTTTYDSSYSIDICGIDTCVAGLPFGVWVEDPVLLWWVQIINQLLKNRFVGTDMVIYRTKVLFTNILYIKKIKCILVVFISAL